jgi:hypothetical protein
LLTCFGCQLSIGPLSSLPECVATGRAPECIQCLRARFQSTPLEVVAQTFLAFRHLDATARNLLDAYDAFLGLLASPGHRARLQNLEARAYEEDAVYQQARKLSHNFRDALQELFFDEQSGISQLTKKYGVF